MFIFTIKQNTWITQSNMFSEVITLCWCARAASADDFSYKTSCVSVLLLLLVPARAATQYHFPRKATCAADPSDDGSAIRRGVPAVWRPRSTTSRTPLIRVGVVTAPPSTRCGLHCTVASSATTDLLTPSPMTLIRRSVRAGVVRLPPATTDLPAATGLTPTRTRVTMPRHLIVCGCSSFSLPRTIPCSQL
jgi:hypothetical protein